MVHPTDVNALFYFAIISRSPCVRCCKTWNKTFKQFSAETREILTGSWWNRKSMFNCISERGWEQLCAFSLKPATAQLEHTQFLAHTPLRNKTLKNAVTTEEICEGRQNFLHLPSAIQSQQRAKIIASSHLLTTSLIYLKTPYELCSNDVMKLDKLIWHFFLT